MYRSGLPLYNFPNARASAHFWQRACKHSVPPMHAAVWIRGSAERAAREEHRAALGILFPSFIATIYKRLRGSTRGRRRRRRWRNEGVWKILHEKHEKLSTAPASTKALNRLARLFPRQFRLSSSGSLQPAAALARSAALELARAGSLFSLGKERFFQNYTARGEQRIRYANKLGRERESGCYCSLFALLFIFRNSAGLFVMTLGEIDIARYLMLFWRKSRLFLLKAKFLEFTSVTE